MARRDSPATASSRLGGSPARNGVPGRKFTLYRARLSIRTSTSRYIIYLSAAVLTAAALAAITVVAATGGPIGSHTRSAAQRPALQAHPASSTRLPVRTISAASPWLEEGDRLADDVAQVRLAAEVSVQVAEQALGAGEQLADPRLQPVLRRLRHPAGSARQQDVQRGL